MKKINIKIVAVGLSLLSLAGCDDFLDRKPLDQLTPNVFFGSEGDLAAYAINAYNFRTVGSGEYGISVFKDDNGTDNQAGPDGSNFWLPGQKKVLASGGAWDFSKIRACNYFFDNVLPKYEAGKITGTPANVKHYIGEMYVIRAYNYFDKLQNLGDFPIIKTALPDNEKVLTDSSKRQPRNKVARFILEDLTKAIELLKDVPPYGKNRISKNVAYLLRARVALFEATWLKYHKGTALVPGGPGWPGKAEDIQGFNIDSEINYFLDEAIKDSKIVGDQIVGKLAVNTDASEGMDNSYKSLNPYYTMFCDETMEGYSEVLMWRQFVKGQVTHNIQMELCRNGGSSGWTRGMVESFLMRNGLPIYAAGSGYNGDADGVNATLANRDSRLSIFTKKDGDINFYDNGVANIYDKPLILNSSDTRAVTGYTVKKGKHYSGVMAQGHGEGVTGSIVFRGTEAMLIYMEAYYERNHSIDATADSYWRALRTRAKVDPDYNKTIAATNMAEEAKGDWGAYSHGQLVDPTLYNIRRERRNELCAEGFRWTDIKRWRSCDQIKNYQIEGFHFWGTKYETAYKTADGKNMIVVDPVKGNMSSQSLGVYIRPYQITQTNNSFYNGYNFVEAHYLEPIAQSNFRQTSSDKSDLTKSVIYQNPGWPLVAGQGAK
jgi:hypothetical protein